MQDMNTQSSSSGRKIIVPDQIKRSPGQADSIAYHCRLYDENLGLARDCSAWQGPFNAGAPEIAAAMWIKPEWDCRHNEEIRVAVKCRGRGIFVARLRTRIEITPLDICSVVAAVETAADGR